MHHVSLIIEFLRGRPKVVFWFVALTQAVLWTVIPALFYSAPPGDVPMVLAVGREFLLGSYLGPPLAFWFAEIAFRAAGMFGLYALSQACIVVALWAIFRVGQAVVGTRHAVLGILLMVGIAAFTVPSPAFGPAVLAVPFWALALMYYWRAVGEGRRGSWFLLGVDLGLLLLTHYIGVILVVLLIVFTPLTARGRRALAHPEPWLALLLTVIVVAPHAAWLFQSHVLVLEALNEAAGKSSALWLIGTLVAVHLGLLLLAYLASGFPRGRHERAPEIDRSPVEPAARGFVYFFALAPAFAVLLLVALGERVPQLSMLTSVGSWATLAALAPLVLLSGLAVVLAAGNRVLIYREALVSSSWLALLVAPPVIVVLSLVVVPWTFAKDNRIAQPAVAEARFFADSFQRRTGKPLQYVSGDARLAPLVAMMTPSGPEGRPHVFFAWAPQRSPWATVDDVATQGGVLVWPAEANDAVPADLKTQFPALVPELPRSFARAVQGRLPLIRLGWSVLRPQAQP
ncbi:MAG: glycosyltransferase family 39 protein [Proteobacteria bacterium]|nr:glycosyltransferase family 39 protein [Pseudomonadota bacterium]